MRSSMPIRRLRLVLLMRASSSWAMAGGCSRSAPADLSMFIIFYTFERLELPGSTIVDVRSAHASSSCTDTSRAEPE
jgi:hypothetical protein